MAKALPVWSSNFDNYLFEIEEFEGPGIPLYRVFLTTPQGAKLKWKRQVKTFDEAKKFALKWKKRILQKPVLLDLTKDFVRVNSEISRIANQIAKIEQAISRLSKEASSDEIFLASTRGGKWEIKVFLEDKWGTYRIESFKNGTSRKSSSGIPADKIRKEVDRTLNNASLYDGINYQVKFDRLPK